MKIVLILLAAGNGRRFGGNKLLYELCGKPLYQHVTGQLAALPEDFFYKKLVVTQYPIIGRALEEMGYQVVENQSSHLGISHSIHLGLEAAKDGEAFCFCVCDQPYLKRDTIKRLVCGFSASKKGLGCVCHSQELGNPAIFLAKYREELMALTGDTGGKRVIRRHLDDLFLCEAEGSLELVDLDLRPAGRIAD